MSDTLTLTGDPVKDRELLRNLQKERHADSERKRRGAALVIEGMTLLGGPAEDIESCKAKLAVDLARMDLMTELGDKLLEAFDAEEGDKFESARMLNKNDN